MAELEPEEFQRWSDIYYKASTSLENREKNVDDAAELIEKVGRLSIAVITVEPVIICSFVKKTHEQGSIFRSTQYRMTLSPCLYVKPQRPVSCFGYFGVFTFDGHISYSFLIYCLFLFALQNLFLLGATAIEDKLQEVSFYFSMWRDILLVPMPVKTLGWRGVSKHTGGGKGGKTRVSQITSSVIGWKTSVTALIGWSTLQRILNQLTVDTFLLPLPFLLACDYSRLSSLPADEKRLYSQATWNFYTLAL